jgi:hypothetical protein
MYYIYHISGIKIGCTSEPEKRISDQGYSDYEILEQHEDIYVASDREQELQKEYGYKVDRNPYYNSRKNRPKGVSSEVARIAGTNASIVNRASGQFKIWASSGGKASATKGNASRNGRIGGFKSIESEDHNTKQKWLMPDGAIRCTTWKKRYCKKHNLDVNQCVRIK